MGVQGNGNLVAVRAEGNAAGHNGNQIWCYNCRGVGHFIRDCTVRPRRRDASYLQTQLLIAQKEEAGIQLQAEEYDLMAAATDLDEIEEVNANCILMANLQQASSSGTQTDITLVYDSDGSAENDNNVISEVTDVEQDGEIVEQHSVNFEEIRTLYESLYQNLVVEVQKVNSVNRKLKETNADLTTKLASDGEHDVNVNETFHEQTDDELSERELIQIEADDQAIQTILLGLPKDIYAAVDSCKTAQEIWLRVQQMMKG
nr:hypothetical protein [Tanacetum cinerariifolium]